MCDIKRLIWFILVCIMSSRRDNRIKCKWRSNLKWPMMWGFSAWMCWGTLCQHALQRYLLTITPAHNGHTFNKFHALFNGSKIQNMLSQGEKNTTRLTVTVQNPWNTTAAPSSHYNQWQQYFWTTFHKASIYMAQGAATAGRPGPRVQQPPKSLPAVQKWSKKFILKHPQSILCAGRAAQNYVMVIYFCLISKFHKSFDNIFK